MNGSTNKHHLSIYYDGSCPLCTREIDHYKKIDNQNKLRYVDISDLSFSQISEGLEGKNIQKFFHIKSSTNEAYTGVDAFYKIWETLDCFKALQFMYKIYPLKLIMKLTYIFFANVRPYLPKKKCTKDICSTNLKGTNQK